MSAFPAAVSDSNSNQGSTFHVEPLNFKKMAHNPFDMVAQIAPKYSTFDLSFDHKTSLAMGKLVPTLVQECLPGDVFSIKSEAMFRMMPMIAPIMHKVDITFHSFFVPNRILWPNWEKYITGGETIASTAVTPAHPVIRIDDQVMAGSLLNYMGIPALPYYDEQPVSVNALPIAAYQRIYHTYYRDQNMQPEDEIVLTDGNNFAQFNELTQLRDRAWEHDYFTSCLPSAQKGDAVELPLDFQDAEVKFRTTQDDNSVWRNHGNIYAAGSGSYVTQDSDGNTVNWDSASPAQGTTNLQYDPLGSLYVDGDDLSVNTTINDLRTAWALQQFLEKNMRGGSRYKESLEIHFNVRSSDQRLQRPEYIGGSKQSIAISEVLQTSSSDGSTPQANMAGHGIGVMSGGHQRFRTEEHGFIITILSILPKTAYYQGIPRFFSKADRYSYAFPDMANLGEQEVLNKEIYYGNDNLNEEVFGYIPRYSEYRYNPSRVSGQMATTLEFWHMARKFDNRPLLNAAFIAANPTKRIFAVEEEQENEIVGHIFTSIKAKRPLPVYGIPAPLV